MPPRTAILNRLLLFCLAAVLAMQFFPPDRNASDGSVTNGIQHSFVVPDSIASLLRNSCYDCHSNSTRYPWYASVQPVGWWLAGHIEDGKDELNFDDFGSYQIRRQKRTLEEMAEMISEDEMPIRSYTFMHRDAALTPRQKRLLVEWTKSARDSLVLSLGTDSHSASE